MNEELKRELEALKAMVGKNVEVLARIAALEQKLAAGDAGMVAVRSEIDALKASVSERENIIRDLQAQGRVRRLEQEPRLAHREAVTMMGMILRAEMARQMGSELPTAYRPEIELVRKYREDVLTRATLTPMSTTGSYLVPTVTEMSLIDGLEEVSPMLSMVDFIPGLPAAGTINIPVLTARPTMQPKRAGTDTAMTASDATFGQVQLSPQETYVLFYLDNKFFVMSPFAIGSFAMNLLRDAMVDKLAYWLLRADGTASYNSITGILAETDVNYVYSLPAGKTAFSDLTATDINKAKAKVFKRGRTRGVWLMDEDIQGIVEELDRTGKVPIITFAQDGSPRIKQRPVVIEEYMPGTDESAAATAFAAFGDLATYIVGMVGGMHLASDASYRFGQNQTTFRATTVMDMKRKPVKTFTTLKTAAQ